MGMFDGKKKDEERGGAPTNPRDQLLGMLKAALESGQVEIGGPEELAQHLEEQRRGGARGGKPKGHESNLSKMDTIGGHAKRLQHLVADYHKSQEAFKVGDLIEWKSGMSNRKFPNYGEPAIVHEVIEGFRDEKTATNTPYFMETLDIRVGILDPGDGEYMVFPMDSRRFKKWEG